MDEYLNESPTDYTNQYNQSNPSSTATPKYNPLASGNTNDFSLNLDYADPNAVNQYGNNNSINNPNFISNNNYTNGAYTSPPQFPGNSNFVNDPTSDLLPNTTSYTIDPFDDLENLNFPHMTTNQPSINLAFDMQSPPLQQNFNPQGQQVYPPNLNEIVSPPNAGTNDSFLNPRYFSPQTNRGSNFNSLNPIAEDDYNDAKQEFGSFKSIPDVQSGLYLSPQNNNQQISPNYDFDNLRSPPASYLNSPPQFQRMGTSIPHQTRPKRDDQSGLLSPPTISNVSSSVPNNSSREVVPTKQLSKEEKLKRRREFHNAVERRRRDLIKERIRELGLIVPPSLLNPQLSAVQLLLRSSNASEVSDLISSIKVKETKPNKSTILNKSVDYINHLRYVLEQQDKARELLIQKIQARQRELNGVIPDDFNPPPAPTSSTSGNTFSRDTAQFDQFGNQTNPDGFFNPDEFFLDIIKTGADGANQGSDFF